VAKAMAEFLPVILLSKLMATLLLVLQFRKESYELLEYCRDLCENTNHFVPLLDVYHRMSALLRMTSEFDMAITASKKLVSLAWTIGNH
jgi:hypothetical protein